jgi:hypothetical protein
MGILKGFSHQRNSNECIEVLALIIPLVEDLFRLLIFVQIAEQNKQPVK